MASLRLTTASVCACPAHSLVSVTRTCTAFCTRTAPPQPLDSRPAGSPVTHGCPRADLLLLVRTFRLTGALATGVFAAYPLYIAAQFRVAPSMLYGGPCPHYAPGIRLPRWHCPARCSLQHYMLAPVRSHLCANDSEPAHGHRAPHHDDRMRLCQPLAGTPSCRTAHRTLPPTSGIRNGVLCYYLWLAPP